MSLDVDNIIDRRRLRRRLGLWRGLAIIAFLGVVGLLVWRQVKDVDLTSEPHVARVTISGMISEDREQLEMLERLGKSKSVAGVILFINSPGGTTTGGEALFEALRQLAAKKPLVAQFGTVAASAAYIAGLATDHIVARGNTITGSVGVIMQWPEFTALMDKVGIKMNEVKSGPLKATPSPFQPVDAASKAVLDEMIAEGQRWFLGLVADRRKIVTGDVPGLEQGRVYSGRRALELKLIDQIGGELEAMKWLTDTRKIAKNLRIVDWKPKRPGDWPLAGMTAGFIAEIIGQTGERVIGEVPERVMRGFGTLSLDGLVSVWQPPKNEQ